MRMMLVVAAIARASAAWLHENGDDLAWLVAVLEQSTSREYVASAALAAIVAALTICTTGELRDMDGEKLATFCRELVRAVAEHDDDIDIEMFADTLAMKVRKKLDEPAPRDAPSPQPSPPLPPPPPPTSSSAGPSAVRRRVLNR